MSLCLAWITTSSHEFNQRVDELFDRHFAANWTWSEAQNSYSSVESRRASGQLYLLVDADVFDASLGITEDEWQQFSHLLQVSKKNINRANWKAGTMKFEKITGGLDILTFEQEVRKRQSLSGKRTAASRKSNHPPETLARAHHLSESGMDRKQMTFELGVSRSSLNRWLGTEKSALHEEESEVVRLQKSAGDGQIREPVSFEFVVQEEQRNKKLPSPKTFSIRTTILPAGDQITVDQAGNQEQIADPGETSHGS
jgi:hypothetical protein